MDDVLTRLLVTCLVLACLLLHSSPTMATATHENHGSSSQRTYIVRVRPPPDFSTAMSRGKLEKWYVSFLPPRVAMAMPGGGSPFIHTYRAAMFGFAVNLTKDDVEYVGGRDGVLKVYEDVVVPLLTTRTPEFLGLQRGGHEGAWSSAGMGDGIIIGILDSGIDFTHASFDDSGMPPPPSRWRGSCNFTDVSCNNKIIGARSMIGGALAPSVVPIDLNGHGTHIASTAAGSFVRGASVLGNGEGTAAGMAPHAHIAVYHVCDDWNGCPYSAIVAGIDAAITDGVDVISMSLGGQSLPFYYDIIAIGAFSAVRKGIFVSCSGGNSGPRPNTVTNEAPWILTVGASTMDRQMKAIVKLGDGRSLVGESAYHPSNLPPLPLEYHRDGSCFFPAKDLTGKILACDGAGSPIAMGQRAKDAGAAGFILLGDHVSGHTTFAHANVLPASYLDSSDADEVRSYTNTSRNSTASIVFDGTSLGTAPAPVVAFFSSRGPSAATPGILKPDIIGPGVNVIAASPFKVGPQQSAAAGVLQDGSSAAVFITMSGTSMATPHLSGIAAIIKRAHPEWSPAAIKSAMMTTAYAADDHNKPILDETLNPASHFAIGSGHVNPSKAIDPGLVYDIDDAHYIKYLCGLGYTDEQVEIVTHEKDACKKSGKITEAELNYPSLAVSSIAGGELVVNRTVTNVGDAISSYTVDIDMPKEVKTSVYPARLDFTKLNEKRTFTVSLSWEHGAAALHAEGSFRWVSGKHLVRSPIAIFSSSLPA